MEFGKNIYIYGTNNLNYKERNHLDEMCFYNFDEWLDSRRLTATIYIDKTVDGVNCILNMTINKWVSFERNYKYRYERGNSYIRSYKCMYERAFSTDILQYLGKLLEQCVFDNYWKEKAYIDKDIELKDRLTKQLQNSTFVVGQLTDYVDTNIEITKQVINNIYGYKKEKNNMPPKSYFNYNEYAAWNLNSTHATEKEPSQAVKDQSRHKMIESMEIILGIKDVKFNDPATIVFWDDGTKTVVKCQKGDKFDPEKGLAMAIIKKQCGHNKGHFNRIFQKWCPDEETLMIDFLDKTIAKESKRPTVFTETAEEYKEEVKKQKKIGDGYDDIRWEVNKRGRK